MRIRSTVILSLLVSATIFFAFFSNSQAETGSYAVTASVPTQVSPENSKVKTSASQSLSDPVNHPILLTVTVQDKNGKPLAGKIVTVTSDRGEADIIEATSKLSTSKAKAANIDEMQRDVTDDNGVSSFRISSFIPGEAKFTATVDTVVTMEEQTIIFRPLPITSYLAISVYFPSFGGRELVIVPEKIKAADMSMLQTKMSKNSNFSFKLLIPGWLFLLILGLIIAATLYTARTSIRLKQLEKHEIEIDKKLNSD